MNQHDLDGCADVFKTVAHPARLLILEALAQGELCACKIAELLPELDRTTVSKHLALMVERNVLRVEKRGVNSCYSLKLACLPGTVECVRRALNGQPCGDTGAAEKNVAAAAATITRRMKMKLIQVFGSGCARCHETENNVREAVAELGLDVPVEFVSDLKKMLALGIMGTPAVAVDGKVVLAGSVPSPAQAVKLLEKFA